MSQKARRAGGDPRRAYRRQHSQQRAQSGRNACRRIHDPSFVLFMFNRVHAWTILEFSVSGNTKSPVRAAAFARGAAETV
jgi:siroheme synthase (precorrin-2 oxidase/ferrochelatase)